MKKEIVFFKIVLKLKMFLNLEIAIPMPMISLIIHFNPTEKKITSMKINNSTNNNTEMKIASLTTEIKTGIPSHHQAELTDSHSPMIITGKETDKDEATDMNRRSKTFIVDSTA